MLTGKQSNILMRPTGLYVEPMCRGSAATSRVSESSAGANKRRRGHNVRDHLESFYGEIHVFCYPAVKVFDSTNGVKVYDSGGKRVEMDPVPFTVRACDVVPQGTCGSTSLITAKRGIEVAINLNSLRVRQQCGAILQTIIADVYDDHGFGRNCWRTLERIITFDVWYSFAYDDGIISGEVFLNREYPHPEFYNESTPLVIKPEEPNVWHTYDVEDACRVFTAIGRTVWNMVLSSRDQKPGVVIEPRTRSMPPAQECDWCGRGCVVLRYDKGKGKPTTVASTDFKEMYKLSRGDQLLWMAEARNALLRRLLSPKWAAAVDKYFPQLRRHATAITKPEEIRLAIFVWDDPRAYGLRYALGDPRAYGFH